MSFLWNAWCIADSCGPKVVQDMSDKAVDANALPKPQTRHKRK